MAQQNAASTALTSQANAASTQVGTAAANAALADTTLSKQADCLTQQATIIKLGGVPRVSCQ